MSTTYYKDSDSPNILVIIPKESECNNKPKSVTTNEIISPPGETSAYAENKDADTSNTNNLKKSEKDVSSALIPIKHIKVNLLQQSYLITSKTPENTDVLHKPPDNVMSEGMQHTPNTLQPLVEQVPHSTWVFQHNVPTSNPYPQYSQHYTYYNLLPEGNIPVNNTIQPYSYINFMPGENTSTNNITDTYVAPHYTYNVVSQANTYVSNNQDQYPHYSLIPQQQIPLNNTFSSQIQYPCCNLISNMPNNSYMERPSTNFISTGNTTAQAYMGIASEVESKPSEEDKLREFKSILGIKEIKPAKPISKRDVKETWRESDITRSDYQKKRTEINRYTSNKKETDTTTEKTVTYHESKKFAGNDRDITFNKKVDDDIKAREKISDKSRYTMIKNKTDREKINKENVKKASSKKKVSEIEKEKKTILKSKIKKSSLTDRGDTKLKTKKTKKDIHPSTSREIKIIKLKQEIEKIESIQKYLKTNVGHTQSKEHLTKIDSSISDLKTHVQQQVDLLNVSLDEYIKLQKLRETNQLKSSVYVPKKDDVSLQKTSYDNIDLRTTLSRKRTLNECHSSYLQEKQHERESLLVTIQQDVNTDTISPPKVDKKNNAKKRKKIKLVINVVCDESSTSESDNDSEYCAPLSNDLSFLDDFNVDEIVESLNCNNLLDNNEKSIDRSETPNVNVNVTFDSQFINEMPGISNNIDNHTFILKSELEETCEDDDKENESKTKRSLVKSEADNNTDYTGISVTDNNNMNEVNSTIVQSAIPIRSELSVKSSCEFEDETNVEINNLAMSEEKEYHIGHIKKELLVLPSIEGSIQERSLEIKYDAVNCNKIIRNDLDSRTQIVESILTDTEKSLVTSSNEVIEIIQEVDEIIVLSDDDTTIENDCVYVSGPYESDIKKKVEDPNQLKPMTETNKPEMDTSDKSVVDTCNKKMHNDYPMEIDAKTDILVKDQNLDITIIPIDESRRNEYIKIENVPNEFAITVCDKNTEEKIVTVDQFIEETTEPNKKSAILNKSSEIEPVAVSNMADEKDNKNIEEKIVTEDQSVGGTKEPESQCDISYKSSETVRDAVSNLADEKDNKNVEEKIVSEDQSVAGTKETDSKFDILIKCSETMPNAVSNMSAEKDNKHVEGTIVTEDKSEEVTKETDSKSNFLSGSSETVPHLVSKMDDEKDNNLNIENTITEPKADEKPCITDISCNSQINSDEDNHISCAPTMQVLNESEKINDVKNTNRDNSSSAIAKDSNTSGKLNDSNSNCGTVTIPGADKLFRKSLSNDNADCSNHETQITLNQEGCNINTEPIQTINPKSETQNEDTINITKKSNSNTKIKQEPSKTPTITTKPNGVEPKQAASHEANNSNIAKNVKVEDDTKPKFLQKLSNPQKQFLNQLETRMFNYLHEKFTVTSIINRGKFSMICKCINSKGRNFAAKVLNVHVDQISKRDTMFLKLQESTYNPNNSFIVYMVNSFNVNGYWCYLLEYYPKNLWQALNENAKGFHINLVQVLAKQLIAAVTMLVNNNMVHTDINPKHILLSSNYGNLKLAGLDEATYIQDLEITFRTTNLNYRAPEIILGFQGGFGIDVWSTAVVIYEMVTGQKLFPGRFNNEILFKQMSAMGNMPDEMIDTSSRSIFFFMGNAFKLRSGLRGEKIQLIDNFEDTGLIRYQLFNAYERDWQRFANKREVYQDKFKLNRLYKLLMSMLVLDPRFRLPISFVGANSF